MDVSVTRLEFERKGRFTPQVLMAGKGIPALVMIASAALIGVAMFEVASQSIKPVVLTSIDIEPKVITSAQILAQTPYDGAVKLKKTGTWNRLCSVMATQIFTDESGAMVRGEDHVVDTPGASGKFAGKPRSLQIPKILANAPGVWRYKIENSGNCWPLEKYLPISGMTAETSFEIKP